MRLPSLIIVVIIDERLVILVWTLEQDAGSVFDPVEESAVIVKSWYDNWFATAAAIKSLALLNAVIDSASSPTNPFEIGDPLSKYCKANFLEYALPSKKTSKDTASIKNPISRLHLSGSGLVNDGWSIAICA